MYNVVDRERQCLWCSSWFEVHHSADKFCSDFCRHMAKLEREKSYRERKKYTTKGLTAFDKAYAEYLKQTGGKVSFGIWSSRRNKNENNRGLENQTGVSAQHKS